MEYTVKIDPDSADLLVLKVLKELREDITKFPWYDQPAENFRDQEALARVIAMFEPSGEEEA